MHAVVKFSRSAFRAAEHDLRAVWAGMSLYIPRPFVIAGIAFRT